MQLNAQDVFQKIQKPDFWINPISVLLALLGLFFLAKLVWIWVDALSVDYQMPEVSRAASVDLSSSSQVSVDLIVSRHLFGDQTYQSEAPVVVEQTATETRLPLKLRGIYAADDVERASAIIEAGGGNQDVYFIGESITGGQGAKLHQVQPTKVILNRSGQLESLTLEQEESVISIEPSREPERDEYKDEEPGTGDDPEREKTELSEVIDNPRIKRELDELKQKFQNDPASLQDMMRWEPVMENGQIQGVKITPGSARRLFYELKLRRNDIVTSINGVPLNDPSQLLMLQQNLVDSSEISLSVLRNGQAQDITIKLTDNQ